MLTKYNHNVFNVEYLSLQVILILINIELATMTMTTVLLFNHKFLEKMAMPTSVNTRMFLLGTDQALIYLNFSSGLYNVYHCWSSLVNLTKGF